MIRRSPMVASIAAAALALAACGNADDEPDDNDGIQDIETPDEDTSGPNESTNNDDGEPTEQEPADEPDENGDTDANGDEDLYAVPDDIDIDYVQTVFDELTRIDSEHLQSMLEREVPVEAEPEDHDTVEALYGGPQFEARNQQMVDLFFREETRDPYLPVEELGTHRFEVMHLHEVSTTCVTAFGFWDISEVSSNPYQDDEFAAWVLHRSDVDDSINPTGWEYWDRTPLIDTDTGYRVSPEEWDEIDLGDSTDTTCEES